MTDYPTKRDYADQVDLDDSLDQIPGQDTLDETVQNLKDHGFNVHTVETGDKALEIIEDLIPDGSTVNNGHSTTLEEIGFIDLLKSGNHSWVNLKQEILNTDDPEEQQRKRHRHTASDYFLGSVNAIAKTGELVAADASGSRVGGYPFAAQNVIIVAGANKIVKDLETARKRLKEYAYPLENERAQDAYGTESTVAKEFIFHQETIEDRTTVILINDNLGF
ncbi:MAG: lactate utilization protein [Candidatus Nanohaloarchaea archaeon]|nr:lactate utilization protein [Candidatus Nanohaloarchaea archaeon]